jgi:hypothetical protein
MNKLEKIELEAQRAREKIAAIQALLKEIDGKRTEQENLQIIRQVRALKLTREELYGFINGGELPPALAGAVAAPDAAPEPETVYSRRGTRGKAQDTPDTETSDESDEPEESATNFESEDFDHEEQ